MIQEEFIPADLWDEHRVPLKCRSLGTRYMTMLAPNSNEGEDKRRTREKR